MRHTTKQADSRPMVQQYTVRANRGKPRIWLEGKRLTHAGMTAGDQLIRIEAFGTLILQKQANGSRKVSGKPERPIIDLSGSSCEPFETGDPVTIEYHPAGHIVIKRGAAQ